MSNKKKKNEIAQLLAKVLPIELLHATKEAADTANKNAEFETRHLARGHKQHALGQMRHFYGNEQFHKALEASGLEPTPIRGNAIITAECENWTLGRFSTKLGDWKKARRSKKRLALAIKNIAIEKFVQGDLFGHGNLALHGTVFFVADHRQISHESDESTVTVYLFVTDFAMNNVLFEESVDTFIDRYTQIEVGQEVKDIAKPKLKKHIKKPNEG